MSNTTEKKRIKGFQCIINWFCAGSSKYDTLTIEMSFDKIDGKTTDRKYVERKLGIE